MQVQRKEVEQEKKVQVKKAGIEAASKANMLSFFSNASCQWKTMKVLVAPVTRD